MKRSLPLALVAAVAFGCSSSNVTPYSEEQVTESVDDQGVETVERSARSLSSKGVLAGEETVLRHMTATVQAVDLAKRKVTLKLPNGKSVPLTASEEVRNLPQIKKGDVVDLDYVESVEFEVRKPTKEELAAAGDELIAAARAPLGEKPAAAAGEAHIAIVTIEAIDQVKETLTVKGTDGSMVVKAKYPENLKFVKVGDTVVVRTAEILAAEIRQKG